MARGWESKGVEDQQEAKKLESTESRAAAGQRKEGAAKIRLLQDLYLQREQILSQRTASPHRRAALQAALASVEQRLREHGEQV